MGRAGLSRAFAKASSSFANNGPAQAIVEYFATPCVEAWARWAVPNASITNTSQSFAMRFAKSSSFFFSPILNLTFSQRTTSPSETSTPSSQFLSRRTGFSNNSDNLLATGAKENSSTYSPSVGRPKCDMSITFAPLSIAI